MLFTAKDNTALRRKSHRKIRKKKKTHLLTTKFRYNTFQKTEYAGGMFMSEV